MFFELGTYTDSLKFGGTVTYSKLSESETLIGMRFLVLKDHKPLVVLVRFILILKLLAFRTGRQKRLQIFTF